MLYGLFQASTLDGNDFGNDDKSHFLISAAWYYTSDLTQSKLIVFLRRGMYSIADYERD